MVSSVNSMGGSAKLWEKVVQDVNQIDESFATARDIGYVRMNQYRSNVIGSLAKYDDSDLYKVQVQSGGKLSFSIRSLGKNESASIEDLEKSKEDENNLMDLIAEGFKVEIYYSQNGGKEKLIADSSAREGNKNRENMDKLLTGDYRAQKGTYYVKVTRNKDVGKNEEMKYALQLQQGKNPKHDYLSVEKPSEDTKAKRRSTIPSVNAGSLTGTATAAVLSAQAAGNLLAVGYNNVANLYDKNSLF